MSEIQKINKFCELIENEDPNFLKEISKLSEESKKIIFDVSKKYQESQKNKKSRASVVCELVRRMLSPSPFLSKKLNKLRGPISVYQLSHKEYPHIFYLFGDEHFGKKSVCPKDEGIPNYIKELVSYSPVFIDVYVEFQYFYKKYPRLIEHPDISKSPENGYLDETHFLFKSCFTKKNVDLCQTSRFHYTDMRFIFETESQLRGFIFVINTKDIISIYNYDKGREDIQNYIDFLNKKDSFVYKRIEKQISNIKEPKIKKYVQKLYEDEVSKKFTIKMPGKNSSVLDRRLFSSDLLNFYVYSKNTIMDIYILSRCFRDFRKTGTYDFPSYNNIIFAGQSHILDFVENLSALGFKTDFKYQSFSLKKVAGKDFIRSQKNKLRCVDISKMKQPLFYQRY